MPLLSTIKLIKTSESHLSLKYVNDKHPFRALFHPRYTRLLDCLDVKCTYFMSDHRLVSADFSGAVFTRAHFQKITQISNLNILIIPT